MTKWWMMEVETSEDEEDDETDKYVKTVDAAAGDLRLMIQN